MKRFFTFSFVATAILFLFGGFFLVGRMMQFRSTVADLKADGFPVSIADLQIQSAAGESDATSQFSRLLGPLGSFETEMYKDQEINERPVDESTIKLFNELDAAYPTVFPLISEIANSDFVGFESKSIGPDSKPDKLTGSDEDLSKAYGAQETLDLELLRLQQVRSCARVLQFKARVLAAQGKPDEALQSVMQIFKITNVFGRHPTLVAHLVRCACRGIAIGSAYEILAEHPLSKESRSELNEILEGADATEEYDWTLVSERAFGTAILSEMGTIPLASSGNAYLDLISDELEQCGEEEFAKDFSFENEISWFDGTFAKLILPALQQTRVANARIRSQIRGLRILNALTAAPEAKDKEVDQKYLLSLGVPEAMTVDTMNGESMKVKKLDDDWVVYSVGPNLIDDGGDSHAIKDFVVGPLK